MAEHAVAIGVRRRWQQIHRADIVAGGHRRCAGAQSVSLDAGDGWIRVRRYRGDCPQRDP